MDRRLGLSFEDNRLLLDRLKNRTVNGDDDIQDKRAIQQQASTHCIVSFHNGVNLVASRTVMLNGRWFAVHAVVSSKVSAPTIPFLPSDADRRLSGVSGIHDIAQLIKATNCLSSGCFPKSANRFYQSHNDRRHVSLSHITILSSPITQPTRVPPRTLGLPTVSAESGARHVRRPRGTPLFC